MRQAVLRARRRSCRLDRASRGQLGVALVLGYKARLREWERRGFRVVASQEDHLLAHLVAEDHLVSLS